ncbi:thioesterase II family protein [Streptomyces sp. NPDC050560]|uniref:thioesterase II family protein n=1 Tax=Streptomyces sp. NPDC050560 TaxID=3365630 RepID=UPI0037A119D8
MNDYDAWIRRFFPSEEAAVQLVCLPHAGGSAAFYRPMAQALSPGLDVLCVQYPGRMERHREPLVDDLGTLADQVAEAVLGTVDRPYALFGHSMGAILAFEVALRGQESGRAPVRVFASGRRAPSTHRDERVHQRDDNGLIADVKTLSGTDGRVFGDDELMRMVLPAIRNDYKAIETYEHTPGPRLTCPVTVLTGDTDPKVNAEEAAAWEAHTDGGFEMHTYRGGHFYLVDHAPEVLRLVDRQLTGAEAH